jgi:hypothetical protein
VLYLTCVYIHILYITHCALGNFRDNWKCGADVLKYIDGTQYTGRFLFDKRWGSGQLTGERGLIYDGEFKYDLMHGQGKYVSKQYYVLYSLH